MSCALRVLLSAGLLAGVLAPRSLAYDQAEMYTYSNLTQEGSSVYAFAVADLEYPWELCQYPYGHDCADWYDAWVQINLYKDGDWRGTQYAESCDQEAFAYLYEEADTGSWQLASEFEVEVEWEDWEYGEIWYWYWDLISHFDEKELTIGCGNQQKDALIAEYENPEYQQTWVPDCGDLTDSAHSSHFSFSELNVDNDYSWGIVRNSLLNGLECVRTAGGGEAMPVNSGYRNPASQMRINPSSPNSRHTRGDAADIEETNAARRTDMKEDWGPGCNACVEPLQYTETWVHFDWRGSCPSGW